MRCLLIITLFGGLLLTASIQAGESCQSAFDVVKPRVPDKLCRVTLNQQELGGEIDRHIRNLIYRNYMVVDLDGKWLNHFRNRTDRGNRSHVYYGIGKVLDAGSLFAVTHGTQIYYGLLEIEQMVCGMRAVTQRTRAHRQRSVNHLLGEHRITVAHIAELRYLRPQKLVIVGRVRVVAGGAQPRHHGRMPELLIELCLVMAVKAQGRGIGHERKHGFFILMGRDMAGGTAHQKRGMLDFSRAQFLMAAQAGFFLGDTKRGVQRENNQNQQYQHTLLFHGRSTETKQVQRFHGLSTSQPHVDGFPMFASAVSCSVNCINLLYAYLI